jgi:hypothetical protein
MDTVLLSSLSSLTAGEKSSLERGAFTMMNAHALDIMSFELGRRVQ